MFRFSRDDIDARDADSVMREDRRESSLAAIFLFALVDSGRFDGISLGRKPQLFSRS